MDEGVDPTDVCKAVMDKVARSEQLRAVSDPEILVLFESWLDELESEVTAFVKRADSLDPAELAEGLGLSRSGTIFLIAKLKREGKL
ncbi:MAG: hypothetical protein JRJ86_04780 [Deltaproteobacteria bacterium]|nr:hypothetical protein [Deltaproteobacteria bacterium]MBW2117612.1 hypothetical protein [Deltaproteobacteria bacterium]MBW2344188.1 hypothetical protein [Deltaproteobacteria bacterium]